MMTRSMVVGTWRTRGGKIGMSHHRIPTGPTPIPIKSAAAEIQRLRHENERLRDENSRIWNLILKFCGDVNVAVLMGAANDTKPTVDSGDKDGG